MNIAILGTRGIPNRYGGFEQCAQELARFLVKHGHHVTVYCPGDHPEAGKTWEGIVLRRIPVKESRLGFLGTILYDWLSLRYALRREFDIILELGYAPASWFYPRRKRLSGPAIVTNMDGLECQRSKWGRVARFALELAEKQAIRRSHALVSDNEGIRSYLQGKFGVDSSMVPYGARVLEDVTEADIASFELEPFRYYLLIARLEPENNIQMILDGFRKTDTELPFLVIGNTATRYGKYLVNRYEKENRIHFLGAVYDYRRLTALRRYSNLYFHGHSVGGTNPSLLEAMASGALIAAHDNSFNRNVLEKDAFFFKASLDVSDLIQMVELEHVREGWQNQNLQKIRDFYSWEKVGKAYLTLFEQLLDRTD
ncbi:MAG: glycosyltransferase family 1 protein [Acidobacteria bacterium]|nr:glycosyltransferase family 1 protein [Acidobacteriota bacterium]